MDNYDNLKIKYPICSDANTYNLNVEGENEIPVFALIF